MQTYQVEFMSYDNRSLIVKTTVEESSAEKAKSCACEWLAYWMGLSSADFKIAINTKC